MQEFEKHSLLSLHIERMANSGVTGPTIVWDNFLRVLNEALYETEINAHMAGQADAGIDPSYYNAKNYSATKLREITNGTN